MGFGFGTKHLYSALICSTLCSLLCFFASRFNARVFTQRGFLLWASDLGAKRLDFLQRFKAHAITQRGVFSRALNLGAKHLGILSDRSPIRKFRNLYIEAQSALSRSRSLKPESSNKAVPVFTLTVLMFLPPSFVAFALEREYSSSFCLGRLGGMTLGGFQVFGIPALLAYMENLTHRAKKMY